MWPPRSMAVRLLHGAARSMTPAPRRLARALSSQGCSSPSSTTAAAATAAVAAPSSQSLRVWNSLTQTMEPLPDADAVTPHVLRWYSCGPTVYDRAHLGHARAYVSQDILRRVLERRLGRHLFLVMGVTDVDDKIIARASERGVRFDELARAEEHAFFRDLARLHVLPPTAVTRVSEHMDDIVQYVQTIMAQGFAYEAADGSGVYFDTRALGPQYGRLDPARSHHGQGEQAQPETEREVETEDAAGAKRDRRDFALWKAAKTPDEPSWPSPWGAGRPGWHIECSAMTHRVLGAKLDVHTGGIDLKFPHHNNEIAQCEAHNGLVPGGHACALHPHHEHEEEWCRHFIHFGHLYIRGLKMSKSLKNFISVQDFLETHSADQFRVFCLQHKYRANIHYADDRMRDAVVVTDRVRNFLRTVTAFLHQQQQQQQKTTSDATASYGTKRCGDQELELLETLFATRVAFDAALCDDFDTPTALRHVMELLARANEYLVRQRSSTSGSGAPSEPTLAVATFVLDVLDVFGLDDLLREFASLRASLTTSQYSASSSSHATMTATTSSTTSSTSVDHERVLEALVAFRAQVRATALQDPRLASNAELLRLCDTLRDLQLPPLGIQIEDLAPGRSAFKLLTEEERRAAETEAQEVSTPNSKAETLKEDTESNKAADVTAAKLQEYEALMQIAPDQLFRVVDEYVAVGYSQFDADGVPTHDADGQELSKSQRKKLLKKRDKHSKAYAAYWAKHKPTL